MDNGQQLAELHVQVKDCDQILEAMENLLSGFQDDLGKLSEEIQTLQDQSLNMSVKLKNRLVRISLCASF
jgi:vacuolar protein sorting-associated protein 52